MINYYDKILSKFKDGIKLIFANYIQLLVIAVVLFGIIWLGYTIRVIGSREISETLTVKILARDGRRISIQPVIQLSHAGNIVPLATDKNSANSWSASKVFIRKVFLVIPRGELESVESGTVIVGDKEFFLIILIWQNGN